MARSGIITPTDNDQQTDSQVEVMHAGTNNPKVDVVVESMGGLIVAQKEDLALGWAEKWVWILFPGILKVRKKIRIFSNPDAVTKRSLETF